MRRDRKPLASRYYRLHRDLSHNRGLWRHTDIRWFPRARMPQPVVERDPELMYTHGMVEPLFVMPEQFQTQDSWGMEAIAPHATALALGVLVQAVRDVQVDDEKRFAQGMNVFIRKQAYEEAKEWFTESSPDADFSLSKCCFLLQLAVAPIRAAIQAYLREHAQRIEGLFHKHLGSYREKMRQLQQRYYPNVKAKRQEKQQERAIQRYEERLARVQQARAEQQGRMSARKQAADDRFVTYEQERVERSRYREWCEREQAKNPALWGQRGWELPPPDKKSYSQKEKQKIIWALGRIGKLNELSRFLEESLEEE